MNVLFSIENDNGVWVFFMFVFKMLIYNQMYNKNTCSLFIHYFFLCFAIRILVCMGKIFMLRIPQTGSGYKKTDFFKLNFI